MEQLVRKDESWVPRNRYDEYDKFGNYMKNSSSSALPVSSSVTSPAKLSATSTSTSTAAAASVGIMGSNTNTAANNDDNNNDKDHNAIKEDKSNSKENAPSQRYSSFLTSLQPATQPEPKPTKPVARLEADNLAALNKFKSMMASIKAAPAVTSFPKSHNNNDTLNNKASNDIKPTNRQQTEPQNDKIPDFLSYQAHKARASVRVGMDYQASIPLQPVRTKPASTFLRSSIFAKPELNNNKRKFQTIASPSTLSPIKVDESSQRDDPSLEGELVWSARFIDTTTVNSYLSTVKNYFKDLSDDYSEDATLSFLHVCQYEPELAKDLLAPGPFSPNDDDEADPANRDEEEEEFCHICGDGGNLIICEFRGCPRVYHTSCLGIDILPKGSWRCPLHYCHTCKAGFAVKATDNTPTSIIPHATCSNCPNSYCLSHLYDILNNFSEHQGRNDQSLSLSDFSKNDHNSSATSRPIYRIPGPSFLCEPCIQERHSKFLKLIDLALSKDPRLFMTRFPDLVKAIDAKGGMMSMIASDEWMSVDKEFFSRM